MLTHHRSQPADPARLVVIGSGGFVGGAIVERAQAVGIKVHGVSGKRLDLTQPGAGEALAAELQPDDCVVVVSAKAPARDAASLGVNIRMIEAVCDALTRRPVDHVLYISTDAVYPASEAVVYEHSPAAPDNPHGAMHVAREQILKVHHKGPLALLRPSLMYGIKDPHNGYGPNRFRRAAAEGKDIVLFGEGEEQRDNVDVNDLAELAVLCARHRSDGILNVATGRSVSFREVAELVVRLSGREVPVKGTPRQNPVTHRHFDPTVRLKAFPDFRPVALEEGLARVQQAMNEGK